jgi:hypothetical protein
MKSNKFDLPFGYDIMNNNEPNKVVKNKKMTLTEATEYMIKMFERKQKKIWE